MAVLNAQYKHPSSAYSQGLKDLIDSMLKVNPADRPDIHQVRLQHSFEDLILKVSRSSKIRIAYYRLLHEQ